MHICYTIYYNWYIAWNLSKQINHLQDFDRTCFAAPQEIGDPK